MFSKAPRLPPQRSAWTEYDRVQIDTSVVIPGPSQRVRPDDKLREEPGIHKPCAGVMDSGLAAARRSAMTNQLSGCMP